MSIKQAALHFDVTDTTIRRRIKAGKLKATRSLGRITVHIECDSVSRQNAQKVHSPDDTIQLQQKEINHLRAQVDKLTDLLALQTQQNRELIAQLPPPRPRIIESLSNLLRTKLWRTSSHP